MDRAAPLPENEGKPVRVCGKVEIVSCESNELVDELLGVRIKAFLLVREVESKSDDGTRAVPVLPGGLDIADCYRYADTILECRLGGFTYRDRTAMSCTVTPFIPGRRIPLRRDEMNPVPEVLQGAV